MEGDSDLVIQQMLGNYKVRRRFSQRSTVRATAVMSSAEAFTAVLGPHRGRDKAFSFRSSRYNLNEGAVLVCADTDYPSLCLICEILGSSYTAAYSVSCGMGRDVALGFFGGVGLTCR